MHTLSDLEVLEEARVRFQTDFAVAPIQQLRFLLEKEVKLMAPGSTAGFIKKPVPCNELTQEQTWIHNKYLSIVEACTSRQPMEEWKRVTVFTRCLLLSARMWRLASYNRDEFSLDWYCDITSLMFIMFKYTLPTVESTTNAPPQRTPTEEVLELHASDEEGMDPPDRGSEQPDLRVLLNQRGAANVEAQPDLRLQLNQRRQEAGPETEQVKRVKTKCYNCRQRGHQAEGCQNPYVTVVRSVVVKVSGSASPARDDRL